MSRAPAGGSDFECLSSLGGQRARVRFRGRLGGLPVTRDATLLTLAAWRRDNRIGHEDPVRQFIEVARAGATGVALTVALAVPAIDLPTVRKTVIMIRNYKRLAPGRHEYGDPVPPLDSRHDL